MTTTASPVRLRQHSPAYWRVTLDNPRSTCTTPRSSPTIGQPMQTAATMAMTALASMYSRNGQTAEAEAWYLKAAELDDPDAMIGLAELFISKGLDDVAAKWRQQAERRGKRPHRD